MNPDGLPRQEDGPGAVLGQVLSAGRGLWLGSHRSSVARPPVRELVCSREGSGTVRVSCRCVCSESQQLRIWVKAEGVGNSFAVFRSFSPSSKL